MGDMIEIFKAAKLLDRTPIQAETIVQQARILADGGTIIDFGFMNRVIFLLKQLGIYGNCKLLTDANFGVKKDGTGAVSKLYDISGNNNDLVQSTGANQLTHVGNKKNGKYGIVSDGNNRFVSVISNDFSLTNNMTVIATHTPKVNGTITDTYLLTKGSYKSDGYYLNGGNFVLATSGAIKYLSSTLTNSGVCAIESFVINNGNGNGYLNGILKSTIPSMTNVVNATIPLTIGRYSSSANQQYLGDIYNVCIFNLGISDINRNAIETMLKQVYGI